ncbi:MAG: antibiotic biosynthesis monooxygenase [Hyphomonadaceae bacterium]
MDFAEPIGVDAAPAMKPRSVCAVVRAETMPGADKIFEAVLSQLAREVRGRESGCESYVITREMGSPNHFAVHMRFDGWSAFKAHAETDHVERAMPDLTALLAQPLSVELFLEV